ncbi:MAG: glycosyltransferase family 4 protein [Chloroflexi bacterium]|nr:MAG: glycosyltransferase family 4 protein [Chloroflexota bacterium]
MPPSAAYPRTVLIVTQYFWPEPSAPSVRYAAIIRTLRSLGVSVHVITGVPSYPSGRVAKGYRPIGFQAEDHEGAHIQRFPLLPYGGANKWLRLLNHGSLATTSMFGALRGVRCDLVIAESPPLPLAISGIAHARRAGVPLVLYVADKWPDVAIEMGALHEGWVADRLRDMESFAYRSAWRIAVPTDGLFARLAAHRDAGPAKTTLLPNGVDPAVFHPMDASDPEAARALGDLAGRALFMYAGTIGQAQALATIVDAAAAARRRALRRDASGEGAAVARVRPSGDLLRARRDGCVHRARGLRHRGRSRGSRRAGGRDPPARGGRGRGTRDGRTRTSVGRAGVRLRRDRAALVGRAQRSAATPSARYLKPIPRSASASNARLQSTKTRWRIAAPSASQSASR